MNLLSLAFRGARAFHGGSAGAGPLPPMADTDAAGDSGPGELAEAGEFGESEWAEQPFPQPRRRTPPVREWLFWALLMCTAMIALPLIGNRWALPGTALRGDACGEVLLLALPAVVALPFLLLACIAELCANRAARTPAAIASFLFALLLGFAALPAWLA